MTAYTDTSGLDPRRVLTGEELAYASARAAPQVGKPARGVDAGLIVGAVAALSLGAITLFMLSAPEPAKTRPPAAAPVAPAVPAPRPVLLAAAAPAALAAAPAPAAANAVDPNQSRANPMVVDNTEGGSASATKPPVPAAPGPTQPGQPSQILTADEQFQARIGGGESGAAHAQGLDDPTTTVMQGTIIPAVLETALNSDLPGYARAIVSREVRGFDGRRIVIPRGSRLIGQYKSGLSTGQSRAFIVWTRLIRPDGVSIALGSPVMDEAGRVGLGGKVDRHFLQRFGGAMLLSVVGALPTALAGGSSSSYVISTGSDAQSAAAQALQSDAKIAPTIRVPLGTPIQVFVARDLDFGTR